MKNFKEGEYIIYRNGESYQIGKIKRITPDGAFVWYHEGDTASKTPHALMHKLTNGYTILETSIGGQDGATVKYAGHDQIADMELNLYDQEEIHENCTVQILRNSITGAVSVGWWSNDAAPGGGRI